MHPERHQLGCESFCVAAADESLVVFVGPAGLMLPPDQPKATGAGGIDVRFNSASTEASIWKCFHVICSRAPLGRDASGMTPTLIVLSECMLPLWGFGGGGLGDIEAAT